MHDIPHHPIRHLSRLTRRHAPKGSKQYAGEARQYLRTTSPQSPSASCQPCHYYSTDMRYIPALFPTMSCNLQHQCYNFAKYPNEQHISYRTSYSPLLSCSSPQYAQYPYSSHFIVPSNKEPLVALFACPCSPWPVECGPQALSSIDTSRRRFR